MAARYSSDMSELEEDRCSILLHPRQERNFHEIGRLLPSVVCINVSSIDCITIYRALYCRPMTHLYLSGIRLLQISVFFDLQMQCRPTLFLMNGCTCLRKKS